MSAQFDFDPDVLRNKYREERDKRLREEGNEQYIEVKGDFAHYIDDPYLEEKIEREPLADEVEIVVIGGALFQTEVTELRWDDTSSRWIVKTNKGDAIRAQFIAMSNGSLNETYGRNGLSLTDKWAEGARTFHGMHCHDFPNLFLMGNIQSGFTANYPHSLNEQSKQMAYILKNCMDGNHRIVEATEAAESEWVENIISLARNNQSFLNDCTPGYYNNEGKPHQRSLQNSNYGAGPVAFFRVLDDWREQGEMIGLELN